MCLRAVRQIAVMMSFLFSRLSPIPFGMGCYSSLLALLLLSGCHEGAEMSAVFSSSDRQEILDQMAQQETAWNRGDLEGFMSAYWKSDSLLFVGSRGPSYGWQTTLDNYKKSYSTPQEMGALTFEVQDLEPVGVDHAVMLGAWRLDRTGGLDTLSGWFSLVWARKNLKWVIVRDHSS
jgi:ketosteroid isomerase-like protein